MHATKRRTPDDPTPTLARDLRRIAELAEAAMARRAELPEIDRVSWKIELETDEGVGLRQTLTVGAGIGFDAQLVAYDCPGAPRRYDVGLPRRARGAGPLGELSAEDLEATLHAIDAMWRQGRELGIIGE